MAPVLILPDNTGRKPRSALTLFALALLACAAVPGHASAAAPRPNIVWIFVEDMNDWMGCYGDKTVPTPNIDSIADRGVRFDRAYMPAAVCSATRSAIALGAMQTSLGVHSHRSSRRWTCRRRRDFRASMLPPSPSDCTPDLPQPGIRSF